MSTLPVKESRRTVLNPLSWDPQPSVLKPLSDLGGIGSCHAVFA